MDGLYILLIFVFTSVELFLTQGLRLPLPKDIEGEERDSGISYLAVQTYLATSNSAIV